MRKQITPERRRELAQKLRINEQYLYQCLTGRRNMSAEEASRLEIASAGELSRKDLCQGNWRRIWPELTRGTSEQVPA
jgi:DNA-binding transcriptional regulator YdaS (Cro superfamily)